MKAIKLCLLLCCLASISWGQVRITEVNTSSGNITFTNMGGSVEDVSEWWVCNFPAYKEMSTLTVVSGSTMLMAGTSLTINWSEVVSASGECGLYNTNAFTSSSAIQDYMEWGAGGNTREPVAVAAGIWCVGEFVAGTSPFFFAGGISDYCSEYWHETILGCTDSSATNYDSTATVDDDSCEYDTDCAGVVGGTAITDLCGECQSAYIYNFIIHVATFVENADALIPGVDYNPSQEMVVMPGDPGDPYWNSTCSGCTDSSATNYDSTATVDDDSCEYPVSGCTDPAYTEFDPYAEIEDSSCATLVVEGCAYSAAINYDSMANTDDGSCLFDCTDPCPGDFDGDLVINTADLLTFLSFFGTTCN